jgi:hypothetical protein
MTMSDTPIAANLNETFDVKVNLFSKFTLDPILVTDKVSEAINLVIGKVIHPGIRVNAGLS